MKTMDFKVRNAFFPAAEWTLIDRRDQRGDFKIKGTKKGEKVEALIGKRERERTNFLLTRVVE